MCTTADDISTKFELDGLFDDGDTDIYHIFGLPKDASCETIKKQYKKLALKYHPDRHANTSDENKLEVTRKFQKVAVIYDILSDSKKRARYDKTGSLSDSDLFAAEDLDGYFDDLFTRVTVEMLENFKKSYQNSDEEREDLIKAYKKHKGDIELILNEIPCSTIDDEDRFRTILQSAIDKKEVKLYKRFTVIDDNERIRRRKDAEAEAEEAEQMAEELGLSTKGSDENENNEMSLVALFKQRDAARKRKMDNFLDQLEEKYANKPNTKKTNRRKTKETTNQLPTEEEFQAIQDRLAGSKGKGQRKGN